MERCNSNQGNSSYSFATLPAEMIDHITSFVGIPKSFAQEKVQTAGNELAKLSLVYSTTKELVKERLQELKQTHDLIAKYSEYNEKYKPELHGGPPQLLCAIKQFKPDCDQASTDIRNILSLMPQSLTCTLAEGTVVRGMRPLTLACYDPKIPISIIELLVTFGASLDETHHIKLKERTLMEGFTRCITYHRMILTTQGHRYTADKRQQTESKIRLMEQRYREILKLYVQYSSSQKSSNSTGAPIQKTAQQ